MKQIIAVVLAAHAIKRTLGTRRAAGFLRNRGFSVIEALEILV